MAEKKGEKRLPVQKIEDFHAESQGQGSSEPSSG